MAQPAPSVVFRMQIKRNGSAATCVCTGKLNREASAGFKAEVKELLPRCTSLVLDFTHVISMDSSGLGAVVALYVSAHAAKCEFRLVNFNQRIRELLGLTRLLSAFEACGEYMIKMP
ncbi:MAG: STAS domain-containing protein [Acidobacteria bacterium]|nr:STAS domain-containing protein [Acidobacteriota bacterium]